MADVAKFSVEISVPLRRRALAVTKRLRIALVQIIREGLTERLEHYEEKFRLEDERARLERDVKRSGRRTLRSLGEAPRPLAPSGPSPLEERLAAREIGDETFDDGAELAPDSADGLDALYAHHAARIAEVLEHPMPAEKRLRVAEALSAIKRYAPLTHPADSVIMTRLERVIVELRARAPKANGVTDDAAALQAADAEPSPVDRFFDDLVGSTINTTKVRTFGDLDAGKK